MFIAPMLLKDAFDLDKQEAVKIFTAWTKQEEINKKIKYATIPILEKLVEQAERTNKNQYPDMYTINETISTLGFDHETVKFPIVMTLDHNDVEVRAVFNIPSVDDLWLWIDFY